MMNDKGYDAENLQKLATFLAYQKVDGVAFDMAIYTAYEPHDSGVLAALSARLHSDCGTAGCAVGHATFIWPKPRLMSYSVWSEKMFIAKITGHLEKWAWMFAAGWASADNSKLGAAKRIQYFLNHNGELPKNWDANEDYNGLAVRIYKDVVVANSSIDSTLATIRETAARRHKLPA